MSKCSYTEEDLLLFAEYRGDRTLCRPIECRLGVRCWVEEGPPALYHARSSQCAGCRGEIRVNAPRLSELAR